ncbi:sulfatase-like hydrolase/transferase [unidentified bacterial endosymbiont]|uniref:sulfatase-like hydrolase/transferase n=1 Tax=unidentified bacterial endosymbiont TaxID=2355 RepID=UPI00209E1C92|nr:sulfatase-like hydrolase/transferase [unidentified bacterial endosymbiont]
MKEKGEINENRRDLLKGLGIAAVVSLLPETGSAAQACSESPPTWDVPFTKEIPETLPEGYNILLITCDQERFFDHYPFPVPGRERLMKTGVTFTQHQNTANVCTPSRSVMYTGLHMPQTRMFDNLGFPWMNYDLDPALRTVGHMMRELGYYSAYKGKWHLTREIDQPLQGKTVDDIGEIPTPRLHQIMEEYGFSDYHGIGDIIGKSKGGYFFDSIIAAQTISWLRNTGRPLNDENKNWFAAINLVNPHDVMFIDTDNPDENVQWKGPLDKENHTYLPTQPPHNKIYAENWPHYPLPANRHQDLDEPGRPAAHKEYLNARAAMEGQFPDEDRRWRKLLNYYFNCIRDNDQHLEAILNELDNLSLTDKTIIVFTADHGELGGAHQMHGKGSSVYKEQVHVPMIIRHPAYPGNVRCNSLTNHLDLVPTLVGLTGCNKSRREKVLAGRKGRDMSVLLAQPIKAGLHELRQGALYCFGMIAYMDAKYIAAFRELIAQKLPVAEFKHEMAKNHPDFGHRSAIRMINDGQYKFARYFSLKQHNIPKTMKELLDKNDIELFDIINDPDENDNLANDPEKHQALIMRMNEKLNQLIIEEMGKDDGSFMPSFEGRQWDMTASELHQYLRD